MRGGENGGQGNEKEKGNNGAPEFLSAYDPDSLITHVNSLNTQERDDLLDKTSLLDVKGTKLV